MSRLNLSMKSVLTTANGVDPDEISLSVAFHRGLHFLLDIQRVNDWCMMERVGVSVLGHVISVT